MMDTRITGAGDGTSNLGALARVCKAITVGEKVEGVKARACGGALLVDAIEDVESRITVKPRRDPVLEWRGENVHPALPASAASSPPWAF